MTRGGIPKISGQVYGYRLLGQKACPAGLFHAQGYKNQLQEALWDPKQSSKGYPEQKTWQVDERRSIASGQGVMPTRDKDVVHKTTSLSEKFG